MAAQGTFWGEVQRAWTRFWRLPWKWKGPALGVIAILVVGIVSSGGGDSNDLVKAGPATEAALASQPSGDDTAGSTEKSTPTPKPTSTPRPTKTPKPAPTATNTPTPPENLTGVTAGDLKGVFEKSGFKCNGPRQGQTLQLWDCSSTDGSILVSWMGKTATSIRSVSATVLGTDRLARDFLGEFVKLAYDGAKPDEANAFLGEALTGGGETTIGAARIVVSGPMGGRSVDIIAIGAR